MYVVRFTDFCGNHSYVSGFVPSLTFNTHYAWLSGVRVSAVLMDEALARNVADRVCKVVGDRKVETVSVAATLVDAAQMGTIDITRYL